MRVDFPPELTERLARMILDHLHREYPHKTGLPWAEASDVRSPRDSIPAFFGSYDWHSSVHSHWALARLLRHEPDAPWAPDARQMLAASLTAENIRRECATLDRPDRRGYEMPYGVAWLFALDAELRHGVVGAECDVSPLVRIAASHFDRWLARLPGPVRHGVHTNTAFALALVHDVRPRHQTQINARAIEFFGEDRDAPLAYEPSAADFVSPALTEATLMRRVLDDDAFRTWLESFLPEARFEPVGVSDRGDYQLSHRDGLNLSRAWMLDELGKAELALEHYEAGIGGIDEWTYAGTHWLPTFTVRASLGF